MNTETKVVRVLESILPTIEDTTNSCVEDSNIVTKCEPESIIFQTIDENGFIHATQHASLIIPDDKYYPQFTEAGKQFSSTTIVGAGDVSQNEMEVTTIHVLGLDDTGSNMEVAYDSAIQVPVDVNTLEVPVEAVMSDENEIQSIHIGDYSTVVNPNTNAVQDHQPMVIASTDSVGNCFVTVQENQIVSHPRRCNGKSQLPTVTRMVQPSYPVGTRGFVRYGRSRMIVDQHTSIPVNEFKAQLSDTTDIIGTLNLAPATKKMMNYMSSKGFGKLFSTPGQKMFCERHLQLYTRHLYLKRCPVEETFDDMTLLPLGYQPEVDPTKIKRITRRRRYPEAEEYQRRLIQEQMQQTFDNLVAESQKNMEAVFLENSGPLGKEDQGNLQILVQAAENDSMEQEGRSSSQLGVLCSENSVTPAQLTNQDVCLKEENVEQITGDTVASGDWRGTVQQFIIIVPIDPLVETITETVITS